MSVGAKLLVPLVLAAGITAFFFAIAGAAPSKERRQQAVQPVTLYVFESEEHIVGPDGLSHETVVPANFVVRAGSPVQVRVINLDDTRHSITAPRLGLDAIVRAGRNNEATGKVIPVTTTFTFTPKKTGVYRWYCRLPCDQEANFWAMGDGYRGPSREGFMAGFIIVI